MVEDHRKRSLADVVMEAMHDEHITVTRPKTSSDALPQQVMYANGIDFLMDGTSRRPKSQHGIVSTRQKNRTLCDAFSRTSFASRPRSTTSRGFLPHFARHTQSNPSLNHTASRESSHFSANGSTMDDELVQMPAETWAFVTSASQEDLWVPRPSPIPDNPFKNQFSVHPVHDIGIQPPPLRRHYIEKHYQAKSQYANVAGAPMERHGLQLLCHKETMRKAKELSREIKKKSKVQKRGKKKRRPIKAQAPQSAYCPTLNAQLLKLSHKWDGYLRADTVTLSAPLYDGAPPMPWTCRAQPTAALFADDWEKKNAPLCGFENTIQPAFCAKCNAPRPKPGRLLRKVGSAARFSHKLHRATSEKKQNNNLKANRRAHGRHGRNSRAKAAEEAASKQKG